METDSSGRTPLHLAALAAGPEQLTELLLSGLLIDVDQRCNDGQTALHFACENGSSAVVRLLLDRGADVEAVDYAGWSGLSKACLRGHAEVARLLLLHGGGVVMRSVDEYGQSAMHKALVSDRRDIALLLLESSGGLALLEAGDIHGRNPLYYARQAGFTETARLLRRHARWLRRRGLLMLGRTLSVEGSSANDHRCRALQGVLGAVTRSIAAYL